MLLLLVVQARYTLRSISDRWIPSKIPDRMRAVRSEERQEEGVEEKNRSQASDQSAGSDHHWIEENLHGV
jgi:hypothetical protein